MLERTRAGGVTLAWVTRDCSYGDDRKLRRWLAQHAHPYVLAVSGKASVWRQQRQQRVTTILAALPPAGWARISAGVGSTGARWDAWLRLDLQAPRPAGWQRWLVVRRRCSAPDDLTA